MRLTRMNKKVSSKKSEVDEHSPESSPGKVLREDFMQPLRLTAYRVAKELGVPPITISEILRGKRSVSPAMACRFGFYFGTGPTFWLALQAWHDLILAHHNGAADGVTLCDDLKGEHFSVQWSAEEDWTTRWWRVELRTVASSKQNDEQPNSQPQRNGRRTQAKRSAQ